VAVAARAVVEVVEVKGAAVRAAVGAVRATAAVGRARPEIPQAVVALTPLLVGVNTWKSLVEATSLSPPLSTAL
jgi:hypothetical protein